MESEPQKREFRPENDGHIHVWIVVECDGEHDIEECDRCGKRVRSRCNFDDEYS